MSLARALKGAALAPPPTIAATLHPEPYSEVREVAEHLISAGRLALVALDGEEREHSVEYLLDTLDDLAPSLARLRSLR